MLTTKNQAGGRRVLTLAVVIALLAGCTPPGPRALLKGKDLIDEGNYVEAMDALKDATTLLNTNAQTWNYFGLACQYAGQAGTAAQAYQKALALDYDLAEVHYNLGCLWLDQNRLDAARTELTTYTSLRKNVADGWLKLGVVHLRSARAELHGFRPSSPAAHSSELGAAEKCLNESLHIQPASPEALNDLGIVELCRDRPRDAAQRFHQALNQQSDYAAALLNLAVVSQLYLNDQRAALEAYHALLSLSNRPPDAQNCESIARELETGLNPSRRPAGADTNTAGSLADRAGISRYQYRSPAKPAAGDVAAGDQEFKRGWKAQQANRQAEAIQSYQRAAQLNPANYDAYYNLGSVEVMAGNLPPALIAYEYALAIRPDSADARYNFALALQQAKYPADAADQLGRLLSYHPNEVRAHLALGNLFAQQLHDVARAREHYAKVLQADPRNPQAAAIRSWMTRNPL